MNILHVIIVLGIILLFSVSSFAYKSPEYRKQLIEVTKEEIKLIEKTGPHVTIGYRHDVTPPPKEDESK